MFADYKEKDKRIEKELARVTEQSKILKSSRHTFLYPAEQYILIKRLVLKIASHFYVENCVYHPLYATIGQSLNFYERSRATYGSPLIT